MSWMQNKINTRHTIAKLLRILQEKFANDSCEDVEIEINETSITWITAILQNRGYDRQDIILETQNDTITVQGIELTDYFVTMLENDELID